MFKEGQRYKFYKIGALGLKRKKVGKCRSGAYSITRTVRAVRMHFTNMFGEHSSYVESFTMNELAHMAKSGELVKR